MRAHVHDRDVNASLLHGACKLPYLTAVVAAAAAAVHMWKPAAHSQSGLIHTQCPAVVALHCQQGASELTG